MNKNINLFFTFLKIGAFTFGGGYAMIPLIHHELVEKKKWISDDEMVNMIAIAESTPGVIAVNSATFVGYKINKFWGSFFSTLGVVLPSFVVITLIALFFENFLAIPIVSFAFKGIRAGVVVLILSACLKLYKKSPKTVLAYFLMAFALLISLFVDFRYLSFALIVFGMIVGLLSQMIIAQRGGK
ncbi:MAG: chromate transporter [Bacilli bacterium]|jgi:chromate transporter|nr:chromate transporter [Bacilli bacterium]